MNRQNAVCLMKDLLIRLGKEMHLVGFSLDNAHTLDSYKIKLFITRNSEERIKFITPVVEKFGFVITQSGNFWLICDPTEKAEIEISPI